MALSTTSRLLKTLGDETRLRILNLLRKGELSVGELQEILNMGQSRISTQLTHLKEVGVLAHRKAGRRSFYSLCTCRSLALIVQVLDDADLVDEFRADDSGYQGAMEKRRQESRSYFDRVAAAFDEQVLPGRTWEGLARGILRLAPRARYVDLGIGDGMLTLMLAEIAESVTAVDVSPEMLRQLESRARGKGIDNIDTVEADIVDLPLESGSYDVAVLSQALHHAHDPGRALREARRILRPGGQLLVLDLLAHGEEWVRDRLQHVHLGFTEADLKKHIEAAGFERVAIDRAARDPQPPHLMTLLATGSVAGATQPAAASR